TATRGLPDGVPSVLRGWMTRSLVPTSPASLRDATTVPTTRARNTALLRQLHAVDHAHDGGVDGSVLHAEGHARRGARHHQHAVAEPGVDGVDGHHVRGLVPAAGVRRAYHEQLRARELLVLAGGDDRADDAAEDQAPTWPPCRRWGRRRPGSC